MAIARLCMKVGKAGKAAPHAAYIAREGQYSSRLERGERLEATEAGNLPAWAQADPLAFWQAGDAYERKGGTTYREMEIALPRELLPEQRVALVRAFVRQEIGDRHAYQWAIHTPRAVDGGEQPHAHLMFSERQRDGIERDPEQYYKRFNAKSPERGGCRKGYGPSAGQTLTRAERAAELKALRGRWEVMCNSHLAQAGMAQRIDMRSHAERGTGLEPERKQLPSQWRGQGRAKVIEFRQDRAELAEARRELARIVPDAGGEIINLEAERRRRERLAAEARERAEQARQVDLEREAQRAAQRREREARERAQREAQRQAEQEKQRLERMSSSELALEIDRRRPLPACRLAEDDPAVMLADDAASALKDQRRLADAKASQAQDEAGRWREAHPLRARLHDAGLVRAGYLDEQSRIESTARQESLELGPGIDEADMQRRKVRIEAERRITAEQAPLRAKVAELEALRQEKLRQEQAEKLRLEAERRRVQVAEQFERMAQQRLDLVDGYRDSSSDWQATPQPLRDLIDDYNCQPQEAQADMLKQLRDDPHLCEQVADMLQQRENALDQGGLSL